MPGTIGNVVNSIVLLASIAYLGLVSAHATGLSKLSAFGTNWAADGFCLSFKDTAFFHTHLLCFYADTAFAALLFLISRGVTRPELEGARQGVLSTFMHGAGHVFLWWRTPTGPEPLIHQYPHPVEASVMLVGFFSFFFAFLSHHSGPHKKIGPALILLQCAVHTVALAALVPPLYLFSYVNTVLLFNLTGGRLLGTAAADKDRFYDWEALLVSTPVAVVTWLEPLLCDSFLVRWGGHVWFDVSIPAGLTVYFLLAATQTPRGATHLKAA
jgi:hypothetical protein